MPGLPGRGEDPSQQKPRNIFGKSIRTRNAGRDDNDISAGQSVLQAIVLGQVAGHFLRGVRHTGTETEDT